MFFYLEIFSLYVFTAEADTFSLNWIETGTYESGRFLVTDIAFVLNGTMSAWKLEDLYKNIVPSKKYISYEKGYKDDIDRYTNTSEILIGKKTHNMENRKQIMEIYDKYKKYIPYEIGVIAILSLIVIFLK